MVSIEGTITCSTDTVNLIYPAYIMNRIPLESPFEGVIHPTESSVLNIPLSSLGSGEQRLSLAFDGPLSRVANGPSDVILSDDTAYQLTIEPNGLLSENMLVYGSLNLMTEDGMVWTVDVVLEATSEQDQWWSPWTEPGRIIGLMLSIVGLSALTSAFQRGTNPQQEPKENDPKTDDATKRASVETDAWGRPIDEFSSTEPLDVEKRV